MSGMFVNVLNENNEPICPMIGCFEAVQPGMGDAFFSSDKGGMVIVHRSCRMGATSLMVESVGMSGVSVSPVLPPVVPVAPVEPDVDRKKAVWDSLSGMPTNTPSERIAKEEMFSTICRQMHVKW
jgi:hypothetical protein